MASRHSTYQGTSVKEFSLPELQAYTNNFKDKNFIGRGAFGPVYKGTIKGRQEKTLNGQKIAVKVSRNKDSNERYQNHYQFQAEKNHLRGLLHENIIELIGYCETPDNCYLIYPYMENGTVQSKISGLDWKKTLKIIKGTAAAIKVLHDRSLVHRDLKTDNILLDKKFTPKLSDFGTAIEVGRHSQQGTEGYRDPVIMRGNAQALKENDIYSLGVVILQLIMKEEKVSVGNSHISGKADCSKSRDGHAVHYKLDTKGTAEAITKLALECVSQNMSDRPSIDQILKRLDNL